MIKEQKPELIIKHIKNRIKEFKLNEVGTVEEKTYSYPYEKDEYIESVIKVANDLGIKLERLIK